MPLESAASSSQPLALAVQAVGALLLGMGLTALAWRRCAGWVRFREPLSCRLTPLAILEVFVVFLALWIATTTLATKLVGSPAGAKAPAASPTSTSPAEAGGDAVSTPPPDEPMNDSETSTAGTHHAPPAPLSLMAGFIVITLTNVFTAGYIMLRNRRNGGTPRDLGLRAAPFLPVIGFTVVMYIAFLPAAFGVGRVVDAVYAALDVTPPQQETVDALRTDPAVFGNLPFILGVCLLTPLLEELIFRGFLYGVLRRSLGMIPSIITSALLFGLLHDARVAMVLMLGGFLAFLYEKTGTLLSPILCHILHNSLTILILRL